MKVWPIDPLVPRNLRLEVPEKLPLFACGTKRWTYVASHPRRWADQAFELRGLSGLRLDRPAAGELLKLARSTDQVEAGLPGSPEGLRYDRYPGRTARGYESRDNWLVAAKRS